MRLSVDDEVGLRVGLREAMRPEALDLSVQVVHPISQPRRHPSDAQCQLEKKPLKSQLKSADNHLLRKSHLSDSCE